MIDFALLVIVGLVTWCVASEGPWGAAMICISVVCSGLLAMNFFEPTAELLSGMFSDPQWQGRMDMVALVGLFALLVTGFRMATDYFCPAFMDVNPALYEAGRWGLGLITGYVTMAFLLTALHTSLLPREFAGFTPERPNLLQAVAPDRQWLGFTQYVSEKAYRNGEGHIFDGPEVQRGDHPNKIWPSFPIRYADRRESIGQAPLPSGPNVSPPTTSPGTPQSGPSPSF